MMLLERGPDSVFGSKSLIGHLLRGLTGFVAVYWGLHPPERAGSVRPLHRRRTRLVSWLPGLLDRGFDGDDCRQATRLVRWN